MTINKAQKQAITHVDVDLHKPVFSHSQLYVAPTHASSMKHIYVLLHTSVTVLTGTYCVRASL